MPHPDTCPSCHLPNYRPGLPQDGTHCHATHASRQVVHDHRTACLERTIARLEALVPVPPKPHRSRVCRIIDGPFCGTDGFLIGHRAEDGYAIVSCTGSGRDAGKIVLVPPAVLWLRP